MRSDGLFERLRSLTGRCRDLAADASDPEVAQTLLQIAEEMELAISLMPEDAHLRAG